MPVFDPFTPPLGNPSYVAKKVYYDENYGKQGQFLLSMQTGLAGAGIGLFAGLPALYLFLRQIIDWYRNKYLNKPFQLGPYSGRIPDVEVDTFFMKPNQNKPYTSIAFDPNYGKANILTNPDYPLPADSDYDDHRYMNSWTYPRKVIFQFDYPKGEVGITSRQFKEDKKKHPNDNEDKNRDNNGDGGDGGAGGAGGAGPSTIPFPPAPPPLPLDEEEEEIIADIIENVEDSQGDRINDKKPPLDQLFKDWWRRATDNATSSLHQAQARVGQVIARSTRTVGTRFTTNPLFQK